MGRKKEPPRAAVRLTESEKKKIGAAALRFYGGKVGGAALPAF